MQRKIRMGMIGGGEGSFIGAVHRMAAQLDNNIELVCGAFSSTAEKSKRSGKAMFLPETRVYDNFEQMISCERIIDENQRMDFVAIVTPNHMHYEPAKLAVLNGFHVICDKPLSFSLEQATELEDLSKSKGLIFAVTHNYTGYPMVKQARHLVKTNAIGKIRKVVAEYPQGWLATLLEQTGQKQAEWRTNPDKSGKAGSVGDIGTHANNLIEYITGLHITELYADLSIFVPNRLLDDDANILIHLSNGAKGVLHCSQISVGEENALNIRIYGELGGIEWHQQEPNSLIVKWNDKPTQIYRTSMGYNCTEAANNTRLPAGHPEGYLEAFANIYNNFAQALSQYISGNKESFKNFDFPTVSDGVSGMRFIDAVILSAQKKCWTKP